LTALRELESIRIYAQSFESAGVLISVLLHQNFISLIDFLESHLDIAPAR